MDINAINTYITNAWYGKDAPTTYSDPVLETSSSKQSSALSSVNTASATSYFDSVNFSQTKDFFSKLKELEQKDPEKFKELFQKLGETLKNAKGYAGQLLTDMSQTYSDPLLETSSSKQSSALSSVNAASATSYFDSVNFSQTKDFFSKLKGLEQKDPEKFKELFQKLGETLKNARGYAGQVLTDMSQSVADGADITDVIG